MKEQESFLYREGLNEQIRKGEEGFADSSRVKRSANSLNRWYA